MSKARPTPTKKRPAARRPKAAPVAKARRAPRKPSTPAVQPVPPPVPREPEAVAYVSPVPMLEPQGLPPEVSLSEPDADFTARVAPPEPDRPLPPSHRAIFFDVENTSRAEHIARVIEHLAVDRMGRRTDFVAVGNWKVIGTDTARLLARHGAQLVHSAPATGVRDWSDLRIAVSAGVWLAGARPGDVIEIVSDDRAFDAVGDVAATIGIAFRRLSYRGLLAASNDALPPSRMPLHAPTPMPAMVSEDRGGDRGADRGGRRRRGRRRGGGSWRDSRPDIRPHAPVHAVSRPHPPAPRPSAALPVQEVAVDGAVEPHTAPHDEILAVVQDLMHRSPGRGVTLDSLANALKSRGFRRTPGSPRLITRLKRIKELEVSGNGIITLVGDVPPMRSSVPMPAAIDVEPAEDTPGLSHATVPDEVDGDESPEPGNEKDEASDDATPAAARRRRSRRGGRGRRGRGKGPLPAATSA